MIHCSFYKMRLEKIWRKKLNCSNRSRVELFLEEEEEEEIIEEELQHIIEGVDIEEIEVTSEAACTATKNQNKML